jgi:hypothetical protein
MLVSYSPSARNVLSIREMVTFWALLIATAAFRLLWREDMLVLCDVTIDDMFVILMLWLLMD